MKKNVENNRNVFVDKWKKLGYNKKHDNKINSIYINFLNSQKDYNLFFKSRYSKKNS